MIEGLVTKNKIRVNLKIASDVVEIHPFGDIHWDTDKCETDRFNDDLDTMKKAKNAYFIGMGDYLDFMSFSGRRKMKNADLHEDEYKKMSRTALIDIIAFKKKIEFMRGRLIGMLGGNHDWVFENGQSGTERLCQMLDCPYLGWLSVVRINLDLYRRRTALEMVVCHGKAGGKLPGTSINQVEDLHRLFPASDICAMGHDHQRGGWPKAALFTTQNARDDSFTIKERTQWLCRTGSYAKAYVVGEGGYVARGLKRPSSLGKITIKIGVRQKRNKTRETLQPSIKVEA